jgi:hypothetical protein
MVAELPLELGYRLAVREVAAVDRLADARKDSLLDGAIRRTEVDERDVIAFHQAWLWGRWGRDARVIAVRGPGTSNKTLSVGSVKLPDFAVKEFCTAE